MSFEAERQRIARRRERARAALGDYLADEACVQTCAIDLLGDLAHLLREEYGEPLLIDCAFSAQEHYENERADAGEAVQG